MAMTPVQQLKLIEGMTPRELNQLKLMEERLRREREECDKLRHTIDAIMGDKVDVRRTKLSAHAKMSMSPARTRTMSARGDESMSSTRSKTRAGVQIMSPLYRPRSSPRSRAGQNKMMYTNFSRSPRFAWQKYEKQKAQQRSIQRNMEEKRRVPDITHLANYRKPLVTPGPGSYDIPTVFSPHKVVSASARDSDIRKKALKNKQGSTSKPRDEDSVRMERQLRETQQQMKDQQMQLSAVHSKSQKEVDFMRDELARRQAKLDAAEAKMTRMQGSLGQLQALSQDLNLQMAQKGALSQQELSMAQEQAATLNEALSGLSGVPRQPAAPAAAAQESAAVSGDDVQSFVEKSVVGSAFRVWEEGNEWTDDDGYKHQGRWVTVHTKQPSAPRDADGDAGPIQFKKRGHTDAYNHLEHIFDLISSLNPEAGADKLGVYITGQDVHDFMHDMRDTEDGQFVLKMLKRARPVHKGGSLFAALDENHDGQVTKYEFIHTLLSTPEKRELVNIFKVMDVDGDGVIVAKEMHDFLHFNANHSMARKLKKFMYKSRKFFLSTNKTHKLFDALDDNHDGAITLHEFLHCLLLAEKQQKGPGLNVTPLSTDEKIRHIFRFYCSFGERFQDHMSGPNWSKCVRDVDMKVPKDSLEEKLVDERNLTLADLGIIFTGAVRYQHQHSPMKRNRMQYDTFLYALRQLATKRFPDMPPVHALKTVLVKHILPLYDDEISNSQTSFAKNEKDEQNDLAEYRSTFRPAITAFFKQHAKGLLSIYSRYCNLNVADASAGGDVRRFASASWDDVKEINETMDWVEFNTFIQDFCIVPRLTTRVEMQRIFKWQSTTKFTKHDQYGNVTGTTEGEVEEHLSYKGFLDCLGMLSMKLFESEQYEDQCPSPRSKLELLFFKMERPPWLLKSVEKKLANHIDTAVRGNIMKCTASAKEDKFRKPTNELGEVKNLLEQLG